MSFFDFQKIVIFRSVTSKIEFRQIACIDMVYTMNSSQNKLYTTFPNFFSYISAISADLLKNQKLKSIFEKKDIF